MQKYDVVIVGADIIGLSIAWQLARRSKLSIILEVIDNENRLRRTNQ